ncbi:expressed unknown protein [Seminavis robusta]|uniref:Myb-like domain-containing protein n=1 Tax=Seminavis robusta TaxID=568900 RepID=A0A9N8H6N6_9STRA|nr:expressed unknown protein [Seminavis robusta]|eukprot:Sro117_g057400.1 n/a (1531) ;mRNA; f:55994-61001
MASEQKKNTPTRQSTKASATSNSNRSTLQNTRKTPAAAATATSPSTGGRYPPPAASASAAAAVAAAPSGTTTGGKSGSGSQGTNSGKTSSPHHKHPRHYYPNHHPYYYPPQHHPPPPSQSQKASNEAASATNTTTNPSNYPHHPVYYPHAPHAPPTSPSPHAHGYPPPYPYPPHFYYPPHYPPPQSNHAGSNNSNAKNNPPYPSYPYPYSYHHHQAGQQTTQSYHNNNQTSSTTSRKAPPSSPDKPSSTTTTTTTTTNATTPLRNTAATSTARSEKTERGRNRQVNSERSPRREEPTTSSGVSTIVTMPINHNYRMPSASASLAARIATTKTLPSATAGGDTNNEATMEPSLLRLDALDYDAADEDYIKFVQSLGLQDSESVQMMPEDEDEEEDFQLTNMEEEDEEDEEDEDGDTEQAIVPAKDDNGADNNVASSNEDYNKQAELVAQGAETPSSPRKTRSSWTLDLPEFDPLFYRELEEELGGLEEEDLEAAVASLLGTTSTSYAHSQKHEYPQEEEEGKRGDGESLSTVFAEEAINSQTPEKAKKGGTADEHVIATSVLRTTTPMRKATGMRTKAVVTPEQVQRLQTLLNRHYQTLVQQAVLAIQAAHEAKTSRVRDKTDFLSLEAIDDLIQVLDSAVGMVQDLDQNRKDAIRHALQFEESDAVQRSRVLDSSEGKVEKVVEKVAPPSQELSPMDVCDSAAPRNQRRLTRAAFSKSLQQHASNRKSVFNIKGLQNLQETFQALDRSIGTEIEPSQARYGEEEPYTRVCRRMLQHSEADYEEHLIPGKRDVSELVTSSQEYLGDDFQAPMTDEQERFFRRFKSIFTSGEDNLLLRGVNLYGEKQWVLIADRFLPDRSINVISQRYSKLCVMLYKANGIKIDKVTGDLLTPPKLESVDDIDDEKVALIKKPKAPAILNVHRWSIEEDLTLLRAVPLMGHMWAEIGARLIPHRDRGHLRKRYQVLERRAKATVQRELKGGDPVTKMAAKIRQNNRKDMQRRMMQRQVWQQQVHVPGQHQVSWQQVPGQQGGPSAHPHTRYSTSGHQQGRPLLPRPQHAPAHPHHQPRPPQKIPTGKPHAVAGKPQMQQPHQARLPHQHQEQQAPRPQPQRPTQTHPKPPLPSQALPGKAQQTLQRLPNSFDSKRKPTTSVSAKTAVDAKEADWSHNAGMDDLMENEAEIVDTLANRLAKPPTVDAKKPPSAKIVDTHANRLAEPSPREIEKQKAEIVDTLANGLGMPGTATVEKPRAAIVDTLANRLGKPEPACTATAEVKDPSAKPNDKGKVDSALSDKEKPDGTPSDNEEAEDETSSMTMTRSGTKRKSTTSLISTRSSKRLAARQSKDVTAAATPKRSNTTTSLASKPSKVPSPMLKSPLRRRPRSSSDQDSACVSGDSKKSRISEEDEDDLDGSPEVNSELFAGGNGTLDGFEFGDLESRRSLGTEGNTNNRSIARSRISANDLEAISALNSLSNSSAPSAITGGSNARHATRTSGVSTRSKNKLKDSGKEEEKSFFATILDGVKERESKRKRKLKF